MTNTNNQESANEGNISIKDLFISELKKALSMETMHVEMLSKLTDAASNNELRETLDDHLDITEVHVNRIEEIFRLLDQNVNSETNEPMQALFHEAEGIIEEYKEPSIRDSNMLNIAQKMEHLEISTYKNLRQYSDQIQNKDISELLQATLDEEEQVEKVFHKIAESTLVHI